MNGSVDYKGRGNKGRARVSPKRLSPKRQAFVEYYLQGLNGAEAYRQAGFQSRHPAREAMRLLDDTVIGAEVRRRQTEQLAAVGVTAEQVKSRLVDIGFRDVRALFDTNGNLRPMHTLTVQQASMIAGIEVIKKNAEAGDGQTDIVHKIKLVDPVKPLEMLAKHFGLLVDRVDVAGSLVFRWATEPPVDAHPVIDVTCVTSRQLPDGVACESAT